MKKYLSLILALLCAVSCLTACNTPAADDTPLPSNDSKGKTLQIVTTIFPEYDWVREIMGDQVDNAQITMLLDNGTDLHSYQPTAEDILKISTCDLFIYVGGESNEWVGDALQDAANRDMQVINLLDVLGDKVKSEELIEGMQESEHEHDHEHEDEEHKHKDGEEHDHEHEENPEYDEHVWLSLKNAQILCGAIADALAELDPENAVSYQGNLAAYCEKLSALDRQYQAAVDAAPLKTLLFGDRFPFRYLVDDYGLTYYAAFVGCSAETEASFKTVAFLAAKVDELGLNTVCTIEKSDQKIAQTIVQSTQGKDQQIVAMNSMQSTTSQDVSNGASYLSIMEDNLEVLTAALK